MEKLAFHGLLRATLNQNILAKESSKTFAEILMAMWIFGVSYNQIVKWHMNTVTQ